MSNFLDSIRNKISEATRGGQSAGGHVLGSADAAGNHIYTVSFTKSKLGMTVSDVDGLPVVTGLIEGGEAAKHNVQAGDAVVRLEDSAVGDYESFMAGLRGLSRPVSVTFRRGGRGEPRAAASSTATAAQARSAGSSSAAAAREQRLAAAEARKKKYDNFGQSRGAARRERPAPASTTFENSTDPEVLRAVEKAKRKEAEDIRRQGYNPYEAKSTSSSQASALRAGMGEGDAGPSMPAPAPTAAPVAARGISAEDVATAFQATGPPNWEADLDNACIQLAANDKERVQDTGTLLLKALKRVRDQAHGDADSKFRRLRMTNASVSEKILGVEGALGVMITAGFELETEDGGDVLKYNLISTASYPPLCGAIARLETMIE